MNSTQPGQRPYKLSHKHIADAKNCMQDTKSADLHYPSIQMFAFRQCYKDKCHIKRIKQNKMLYLSYETN